MGEKRTACRMLVGNSEGNHQENLDIGGVILLKWILER
jgi:hypothetical protein